ncbi:MAG: hypothetical protein RMY34_03995 [Aulosira sp. DedQUE10]|nr:hypothetical protein [Aulosira sp. DedQUE10]
MAKFLWAIICGQAILNAETDNFSLIEILQEIELPIIDAPNEFFFPIDFDLVVSWERMNQESDLDSFILTLRSPSDQILLQATHSLKFSEGSISNITVFHFNGIPISSPGYYTFKIAIPPEQNEEAQIVGSVSLNINYLRKKIQ